MSNNLPPIPSSQDKPEETGDPGYGVRRYMLLSRPSHKIRVAILDDHPAITLGLAAYLRNQTDLEVKCVETRADALSKTLRQQPCDVAVVD
ncbi:DNA-binding response regulator, partial [Bordetella avium]